jgi:CheY-like chemotaxis protein
MTKPTTAKLSILVVDDEPLVCDAVKMLLMFDSHKVETAPDGPTALAAFAPGKFDLVVVDYEMPGMKGDQLAVAIKERAPRQPVLMLTAHGDMLRSSGRPLAGVDLIVDKPFRLETLRESIAKLMVEYSGSRTE